MHVLDNPVWHALDGPQKTVAEGGSAARRYRSDVAPFAAVPDEPDAAAWNDLAALAGSGSVAIIVRGAFARPEGWAEVFRAPAWQMVAPAPLRVEREPDVDVDALGEDDLPEMTDLVGRTEPGPFGARTIELDGYHGVKVGGTLVAMAGQRMRPTGFTEISAVCTDTAHRGRGYAAKVVATVARGVVARGETPMLHVRTNNTGAIRVYSAMGFTVRRSIDVVGLRVP